MALTDALRRLAGSRRSPYPVSTGYFGDWQRLSDDVMGLSPAEVWRTQPHLRTVVTFMARNVAQLGLHTFQRQGETDRVRLRDGALVGALSRPNANTTAYELIYGTVADLALYDVAYWHPVQSADAPSGWELYRLPPTWVTPAGGDAFGFDSYVVSVNGGVNTVTLDASAVLPFHGWNPTDTRTGSTPVAALKAILAEQLLATQHRKQVWQRGGRVSAVLSRPAGVGWSDDARKRFMESWRARFTGDGEEAGGTPILEDGMTLQRMDFNAQDMQFVEAAKLALSTVASVYHVNPTMLGVLDNANYSNVREFRRGLYGDTLGPVFAELEDRLNTFLVPLLDPRPGVYVEFNIGEKLQGSFEEQAAVLQTSTGGPWMTRNEARARLNLPALPGGDELVVPLNVAIGGQASPTDSAPPPKRRHTVRVKARADGLEDEHRKAVEAFFDRQAQAVRTRLGAKSAEWWDTARWDGELADDLYALAQQVAAQVSAKVLDSIGYGPDAYDAVRTEAWLRDVAERSAASINASTLQQLEAALDGADDKPAAVSGVYDTAKAQRAPAIAASAVTLLSAFATHEVAQQVAPDQATKTWVTGPRARPEHAALNGQTVPLGERFSNGGMWPGDGANLGADDLAGCNCSLSVSVPTP